MFIFVELTSVCDMACEFCCNSIMSRPKKHMDFDMFLNIIDQIVANHLTREIGLAAIGESLLYPKLFDAIEYCTKKGLDANIITNGLGLTTELYQELVDKGLKGVYISLHNLTEDSYVYRHAKKRISYPIFYQNIMKLVDYHVSHNISMRLTIALIFCNPHWISSKLWDLPAMKRDTKNAKILSQNFIDGMNKIAHKNNTKCYLDKKSYISSLRALIVFGPKTIKIMENVFLTLVPVDPQLFNTRKKLEGELGKKIKLVKKTKGSCPHLGSPMILSNGSFIPCCVDGLEELVMGKVTTETSLISIINSEKYQNLIEGFKNGNIINPTCQECRGRLVYKNPLFQMVYLVSSFNIYTLVPTLFQKFEQLLLRFIIFWWIKLSEQNRNKIRKLLGKVEVFSWTKRQ